MDGWNIHFHENNKEFFDLIICKYNENVYCKYLKDTPYNFYIKEIGEKGIQCLYFTQIQNLYHLLFAHSYLYINW